MSCTPKHILSELGAARREEGRIIMSGEKIDSLMAQATERIARLQAVNKELLEALQGLFSAVSDVDLEAPCVLVDAHERARVAIKSASALSTSPQSPHQDLDSFPRQG